MGAGFSAAEIEGAAESVYAQARRDPDLAADPIELAEALLGAGSVRLVHAAALPGLASLARVGLEWRIYVRSSASEQRRAFAVLHELGHYVLGIDAGEGACDALAAALLLPRRAFMRAARELGADWPALASRFGCSESAVALRWGEVVSDPLALVAPRSVRIRGADWAWPHEPGVRALARKPGPGLARARLTDDARRIVLRAVG